MKFALVNDIRTEPSPRLRGNCLYCGEPTTSRCGSKHIWHWAHIPNNHCDPWWENETQWHREWKSFFKEANQEVVHFDEKTGEKHVADIKTNTGRVIELQNSPIDSIEVCSRESFYGDMIWIVNGERYADQFNILGALPNPDALFAQDVMFFPQQVESPCCAFWRLSENPNHLLGSGDLVRTHSMSEIEGQIKEEYIGHHLFDWNHPRTVWYESKKPVYFDFGSAEFLFQLQVYQRYGDWPLRCVQKVYKQHIIESNGGVYIAAGGNMTKNMYLFQNTLKK
jgi:competence protein CoiA